MTPTPTDLRERYKTLAKEPGGFQRALGETWLDLWMEQAEYNRKVQNQDQQDPLSPQPIDEQAWTQTYLLGLTSEIDEVLNCIHWKRHQVGTGQVIRSNLAGELTDLLKYTLSLWQLWGFSMTEMLEHLHEKNQVLEAKWRQEFETGRSRPWPFNRTIIVDIDGTVANYRDAIVAYFKQRNPKAADVNTQHYLMDLAMLMEFTEYNRWKDMFEQEGGYRRLEPFPDAVPALRSLAQCANIVAVTARPKSLSRCWADTYFWLREVIGIEPTQVHLMGPERVKLALHFRDLLGMETVAWDDEPHACYRYAENGIRTFMRQADYNAHVEHPNIIRVDSYSADPADYFQVR